MSHPSESPIWAQALSLLRDVFDGVAPGGEGPDPADTEAMQWVAETFGQEAWGYAWALHFASHGELLLRLDGVCDLSSTAAFGRRFPDVSAHQCAVVGFCPDGCPILLDNGDGSISFLQDAAYADLGHLGNWRWRVAEDFADFVARTLSRSLPSDAYDAEARARAREDPRVAAMEAARREARALPARLSLIAERERAADAFLEGELTKDPDATFAVMSQRAKDRGITMYLADYVRAKARRQAPNLGGDRA